MVNELLLAGFEAPSITEFMPEDLFFAGTPFAINRIIIIRFIMAAVLMLVFYFGAKKAKIVPNKLQSFCELLLDFVRDNIVYNTLGEERGKRFFPMIATIFCSILFFNISGILPGLNMAGTAGIGLPMVFAIWVLIAYWKVGIKERGLLKFVREETMPKSMPAFAYPIYTPIELSQLLIVRPFSLTVRLFANMIAGHILIGLCINATNFLVCEAGIGLKPAGIVTFFVCIAFTLFEVFVAALQAYIFALLSASYIGMSFAHDAAE